MHLLTVRGSSPVELHDETFWIVQSIDHIEEARILLLTALAVLVEPEEFGMPHLPSASVNLQVCQKYPPRCDAETI